MDGLIQALKTGNEEIVHFQFNFGFFRLEELAKTITALHTERKIMITFHKTKDADVAGKMVSLASISNELNLCSKLVVHQEEDRRELLSFGVRPELITVIPHGQITYESREKKYVREKLGINRSLVLGSYGFLLPHKGVLENIKALGYIQTKYEDVLYIVCCALHNSPESRVYYQECRDYVQKHGLERNVVLVTDYLELEESMVLLQACDILLMNYLPTEESASGAIRFCVAAQRPIITTKQEIFEEFQNCVIQIDAAAPKEIANAVVKTMETDQSELLRRMRKHCEETSWESAAEAFDVLYRKLDNGES